MGGVSAMRDESVVKALLARIGPHVEDLQRDNVLPVILCGGEALVGDCSPFLTETETDVIFINVRLNSTISIY